MRRQSVSESVRDANAASDYSMRFTRKEWAVLIPATACALPGLLSTPPWILFPCLFASWVAYIYICIYHQGAIWIRGLAAILISGVLGLIAYFHVGKSVPEPLLTSQIEEIKQLEDFIGGKDETGLRELFDFPRILRYDILFSKRNLAPDLTTKEQSQEIDNIFHDGNGLIDARYSNFLRINNGGLHYEPREGCLGALNTTKKFADSKQELMQFEASPLIPIKIRISLQELDKTIEEDKTELVEVLNEKYQEDPKNIIYEDDADTPFFGVTTSAYWDRFKPLKPIVDRTLLEASSYLGTSN
jgi:hypothetical protein